uniref:Uncharacterized protein n=1 Tax=Panagrolaimus sp. PS1159 TaxID=55785 RepID=A0AC35FQ07_9BILA
MASDIFLYATTAIAFLSCVGNAQPFFGNNNNNGYPSSTIQRGYQPPPSPPLLPQFYQQSQPQPHQQQQQQQPQQRQYQFGPFQPQFVAQKPQPTQVPQNSFTPSVTYPIDYPVTSNHAPPQRFNNPTPQTYNPQPISSPPPSMRFIPNPHPPIIINTLIQVYVDGKNKTVGNPAFEGRVVTGIQNNDRVILTKEFDVKTHKFIEENGKGNVNQKNLIQVNAVADTNSTKIARDDLQKELEKELEHSIPLILDELDKVKINNKINMAKDNTYKIRNV